MPATLPCPRMAKQPAKNGCSAPSRSTYCRVRNSMTACAIVRRRVAMAGLLSSRLFSSPQPASHRIQSVGRASAGPIARIGAVERCGCLLLAPSPVNDTVHRARDHERIAIPGIEHVAADQGAAHRAPGAQGTGHGGEEWTRVARRLAAEQEDRQGGGADN